MSECVLAPQSWHPLLYDSLVFIWQVPHAARILHLSARPLALHCCCKNQTFSDQLTCPKFKSKRQMRSVSSFKLNYYNDGISN
jgi:hypothetical protein